MACRNGTLEGANYSAPVPVIGVYIAAASMLLLLIMVYDIIFAGLGVRKRWLPCQYFTLNSVTLTLLGLAAKLPVDLTSEMPRPVDQLSKLTATVLICVAMAFLLPSIGKIRTGVIVLFVWEHIVIMCLMFLLLALLWQASFSLVYTDIGDRKRRFFSEGWEDLFDELRECNEMCYECNSQLEICMEVNNCTVGGLCLISSAILAQAAIRSLVLKKLEFCFGASDYVWSTWIIVVTQIIFVLVGCFATTYRWLTMMRYTGYSASLAFDENKEWPRRRANIVKGWSFVNAVWKKFVYVCLLTIYLLQLFFECVTRLLMCVLKQKSANHKEIQDWRNRKATEDVNRLVEVGKKEAWVHLHELLSRTGFRQMRPFEDDIEIAKFPLIIAKRIKALVVVSELVLPHTLRKSIVGGFAELEKVLFFAITVKVGDEEGFSLSNLRQHWDYPRYEKLLGTSLLEPGSNQDQIADAIYEFSCFLRNEHDFKIGPALLLELDSTSSSEYVFHESVEWLDHNAAQGYSSLEHLANSMEQLFIDYLGIVLVDLPEVVAHFLLKRSDDEFERN